MRTQAPDGEGHRRPGEGHFGRRHLPEAAVPRDFDTAWRGLLEWRTGTGAPTLQRRIAMKFLTAIPVYNEERHVEGVLREVRRYSPDIVVVDDGSTDRTAELLAAQPGLRVVTHPRNRGYGAALISAF